MGGLAGMRGDVRPEVAGIPRHPASARILEETASQGRSNVGTGRLARQRHNTFLGTVPALPGTTSSIQFASPPRNIDLVRRKSPSVEIEDERTGGDETKLNRGRQKRRGVRDARREKCSPFLLEFIIRRHEY